MNKLFTIALLTSLTSLVHADCGCAHSPKDHINTSDARATGREVKNKAYDAASDIKEGVKKTAQNVKEDFDDARDTVANSKTAQSAKDAANCAADKTKRMASNAKDKAKDMLDDGKEVAQRAGQKAKDALEEGKEVASRAGQLGKEVMKTAGNTIKETALKVVDDVTEGAMEVKGDYERAKERSKRS